MSRKSSVSGCWRRRRPHPASRIRAPQACRKIACPARMKAEPGVRASSGSGWRASSVKTSISHGAEQGLGGPEGEAGLENAFGGGAGVPWSESKGGAWRFRKDSGTRVAYNPFPVRFLANQTETRVITAIPIRYQAIGAASPSLQPSSAVAMSGASPPRGARRADIPSRRRCSGPGCRTTRRKTPPEVVHRRVTDETR